MKKVYLAGPDVFKPNAIDIGKSLVKQLAEHDLEGLFPLDNEFGKGNTPTGLGIAEANTNMIERCDGVLAHLVPFRGPSADVGTVWECAYAKALGKIVVGYGYNPIDYKDKVIGKVPHDGMMVENFGVWDNIMLVYGLDSSYVGWLDALHYMKQRLVIV